MPNSVSTIQSADHDPAATDDQVGETFQHGSEDTPMIVRCQIVYDLTKW